MANSNNWRGVCPKLVGMDNHYPENLPEVEIDVKEYVRSMKSIGTECISFDCKDAYGNCYYETRLGHKNSRVKGDPLKELISAAHENEIKVVAYFNVCCNDVDAVKNPDYCQRDAKGGAIDAYGYRAVCMNSPIREVYFAQLREIAENYDVDAFFFDITYVFGGSFGGKEACYCEYCRELYKQIYGGEIPVEPKPGSVDKRNFFQFKRWTYLRFTTEAVSTIKSIREVPVGWNGSGSPYHSFMYPTQEVEAYKQPDYLASEAKAPNYVIGDLQSKWARSFKKPFELWIASNYYAWGEWTVLPSNALKLLCTTILANGGNPAIGELLPYPSGKWKGKLAKGKVDTMKEVYKWVDQIEDFCVDVESVPYVAILHSAKSHQVKELLDWSTMTSLHGAHRLLLENQLHFDIIREATSETLSEYEALVLPDEIYLSAEEIQAILGFVKNGGGLIASYRTSLYNENGLMTRDFALGQAYGVKFSGFSPYSVNYISDLKPEIGSGCPDMPLLVKDRALQVKVKKDAQTLARLTYPAVEQKWPYRHVHHQDVAHPATESEYPAITYNVYGKGRCVYFAQPVEAGFGRKGYYWLRKIYANALRKVLLNPMLEVNGPLSLQVSLMEKEGKRILHLINYYTEKTGVVEEFPETRNVQVKIRSPHTKEVVTAPAMEKVEWSERNNGIIEFQVPPFKGYAAILIS